MRRDQALAIVIEKVNNEILIKHMLAVEAIMRELASKKYANENRWGLAGLLHDIDYTETACDPKCHGLISAKTLEKLNVGRDIVYAIKAHAGHVPCVGDVDWALYASDPTAGLISAAALTHPTKKLSNLDIQFVINRFNEKRFALGVDRNQIRACEKLGFTLEEFMEVALTGMQKIAPDLGL